MKCKKCNFDIGGLESVCTNCGESQVKDIIEALNNSKDKLISIYSEAYNALKIFQKLNSSNPNAQPHSPLHPMNFRLLDMIPEPKDMRAIDVAAFAVSVNMFRFECFFNIEVENQTSATLGRLLRSTILTDFENIRSLQRMFFQLETPFFPSRWGQCDCKLGTSAC